MGGGGERKRQYMSVSRVQASGERNGREGRKKEEKVSVSEPLRRTHTFTWITFTTIPVSWDLFLQMRKEGTGRLSNLPRSKAH